MMSKPTRLHPIALLIGIVKSFREAIIPLVVTFFVFWRGEIVIEGESFWLKFGPYLFIFTFIVLTIISNFTKWLRYTYRLEESELRIEHGLFVKKKRYIPFERIQSLDFSEGIFHRPFGLVKVKIETAGGNADGSEAEMVAIKKEEALSMREVILQEKRKIDLEEIGQDEVPEPIVENLLYKITRKQLLFFASTSGSVGVIISAVIAFIAQFDELIPFDRIFAEMEHIVRAGFIIIIFLILLGLLLAWVVSVFITYLKYNDFTLKQVKNDIVITRGLLEKRTTSIPIRRIQAIRIVESVFRQPFGYASVSVEYAGSTMDEGGNVEGLLMPVVKKKEIHSRLEEVFPQYVLDSDIEKVPRRAKRRFYFIKVIVMAIIAAILSIWLWPYGLFSTLLIIGAWIIGFFQFQSAGWNITGNQLTLRYRHPLQQQTVFMQKNRMQSLDISVNWFQKRSQLATITTAVMSGGMGATSSVKHLDEQDAKQIYEWYRPVPKTRTVKSIDEENER